MGGEQSPVNVQPFVFALGLILSAVLIWSGHRLQTRLIVTLLISIAVYFLFKVVFFTTPAIAGGNNIQKTLTEIIFFLGLIFLASQVMINLRRYKLA